MRVHRPFWIAPSTLLLCGTACVCAQANDTLQLNASESLTSDSNLFRLPASANINSLIGKTSAAEKIASTSLGLSFNKAYSLQQFKFNLQLIDYRYQNFDYLNFTARNYDAAWRWALTPRLTGNLTSNRKETLNSFADYQGFNQRNQRTNTSTSLDAAYKLAGPWHALAGVSQSAQSNLQPLLTGDDTRSTAANAGLRYVFASGSALTYTLKKASGQYLNRTLSQASLQDDGFSQLDNELKLHWAVTGKSTVDLRAAHFSRTHPHFSQRDFSGPNAGVTLNWNISGKSALTASWARDLASNQSNNSNYTQTDRLSIGPTWQVSPKTVVSLHYEAARIDYLGSPAELTVNQRSDTTRNTSLSLEWQPHQRVTLSATLQNTSRASNLTNFDFDSHIATVTAQLSY